METAADDDELALAKVSASLLDDLETQLRRLIYKSQGHGEASLRPHSLVRNQHLDSIIKLIEPFQSDPQLLDPKLKVIVPLIAEAYLEYIIRKSSPKHKPGTIDVLTALSTVLYLLCKVRGRKVISGLLNNEPRFLEPLLLRLEQSTEASDIWQVQFVLLLWLAHLLLTPFDLATISDASATGKLPDRLCFPEPIPSIAQRIIQACLGHLARPAASQDVAALALSRLALRPDMQRWHIADGIIAYNLSIVISDTSPDGALLYEILGNMRVLAILATSSDITQIIPEIYHAYASLMSDGQERFDKLDAVGRKLLIKTVRNIVTTACRAARSVQVFETFVQETDVLENTIDFLIRCLSDRETMVRHAAAKALSAIVLELGPDMGHEIISSILVSFQAELPGMSSTYTLTANASACHGYTLTLAFALLKRSVSVDQLSITVWALLAALVFEQRTTTGSISGTSIRDAANFGVWSVARRYTTAELESADVATTSGKDGVNAPSIIETIAMSLLQSACCDPIGNVRRGSSAALQELVGRHPDKVAHGIALVQAVDYQAVGLRRRAMTEVAAEVMRLDERYWTSLMDALIGWRGLGSVDVPARDAAAASMTEQLISTDIVHQQRTIDKLLAMLQATSTADLELSHGIILSLAVLMEYLVKEPDRSFSLQSCSSRLLAAWQAIPTSILNTAFSTRAVKAELAVAGARLLAATHKYNNCLQHNHDHPLGSASFVDLLLSRSEDVFFRVIPSLILSIYDSGKPLPTITPAVLAARVTADSAKPSLIGAGRAFAIATSMCAIRSSEELKDTFDALRRVCMSAHVDWRIVGLKSLEVLLSSARGCEAITRIGLTTVRDVILAGLSDYTIDQRGDIGSLVRLQALLRTQSILERDTFQPFRDDIQSLQAAVLRLSLEKLSRVRLQAAHCRSRFSHTALRVDHCHEVESITYFEIALEPLWSPATPHWALQPLLEGLISCGGSGAEHTLHTVRLVAANRLRGCAIDHVKSLFMVFIEILRQTSNISTNLQSALELLAFLLQMRLLDTLRHTDFKFRTLLSLVQKAHYKSTDVQKILAAVAVYVGLGEFDSLRAEVLKKLLSMLKSNPYPNVRAAVADALFILTHDGEVKKRNWSKPAIQNAGTFELLQKRLQV